MRISRSGFLIPPMLGLVTVLGLSSCGDDSTEPGVQPTILLMYPRGVPAGGNGYGIVIYGQDFAPDATVHWNGEARSTWREGTSLLHVGTTKADLAVPGTANVTVFSNGRMSTPVSFIIGEFLGPDMTLTSVTPTRGIAGVGPLEITVTGSGFVPGTALFLDGSPREATLVSNSTLHAVIEGLRSTHAPIDLRVGIPGFWITPTFLRWELDASPPVISGLSPATASAGSDELRVRVLGSGFIYSSVVWVNGVQKVTWLTSETELGITLFPVDLASAGTLAITVVTPPPGGGTSSVVQFIVTD